MEQQDTQVNVQPIPLPERTREALIELVRQREALDRQINNIVATAQDCLGVPQGWRMRDVLVGFEPVGGTTADGAPPTLAG